MMIKTNILLIVLVLSSSISYTQPSDTIYGKIKSIREKITFLNDKKQNYNPLGISGDYGHSGWNRNTGKKSLFNYWWYNTPFVHYINYYKEFDKNNNTIKEEWYFKNQNIVMSYINSYNELGNLILQNITDNRHGYVINNYNQYSVLNSNDTNNNLIYSKTSWADDSYSINSRTFDSINNIKSEYYYDSSFPKKTRKTEYFYDKNSNLIEIRKYEGDNETYGTKYEYDNKNRRVKIIHHSPYIWIKTKKRSKQKRTNKGSDRLYQTFSYDSKNRIVETQTYKQDFHDKNKTLLSGIDRKIFNNDLLTDILYYDKSDSLLRFEKYKYDTKNRKIIKVVKKPNQTQNIQMLEYSYGRFDLPIRLVYMNKGERVEIDFEYEFDKKNNLDKANKNR